MINMTNWKQKLGLMALGSVFTIIGMLLSPITAQQDKKFRDIECETLTTQWIQVYDPNSPEMYTSIDGGKMNLRNSKRNNSVYITTAGRWGSIAISDGDDGAKDYYGLVRIGIDKHGGYVVSSGKGKSKGRAGMGINEKGNGAVSTYDKKGYLQ